jgi:hypothetical protein
VQRTALGCAALHERCDAACMETALHALATHSGETLSRVVTFRGFGWEIAHAAVSRRPPIYLDTMVARTHMYTYAATVWDLSFVEGLSLSPVPNLRFATCFIAVQYKSRVELIYPRGLNA